MQEDRGIYAAKQGMRACNNNNMRNPSLHPLILGYACYYCCMPSFPVLLHIYCTCFSTFWHCRPYIFQHFSGNVFILLLLIIDLAAERQFLFLVVSPTCANAVSFNHGLSISIVVVRSTVNKVLYHIRPSGGGAPRFPIASFVWLGAALTEACMGKA